MTEINKAVLLAAGLGTRLRPLTLTTPKPLLPLGDELLIDRQLKYLASAGIKEVAINLHHLGDKIKGHVENGSRYGLKIYYSHEPEILGTGGGIKQAAALLRTDTFLALNSDALQDTDIGALVEYHVKTGPAATMVVKAAGGEGFNPVEIDGNGMIVGFGGGGHFYTGLQIIGQDLVNILPPVGKSSCLIKDGYMKLIEGGIPVASFLHTGYFNDVGTMESYQSALREIAGRI